MGVEKTVALITGAGRPTGIGCEVAAQLGERGFTVILTARNAGEAEARARELARKGHDVMGRGLDVTNVVQVRKLADEIAHMFGKLDILVNNAAGVSGFGEKAATADLVAAHDTMEVTLFGAWRTAQATLPLLRNSGRGRIVNVSSGAGSHVDPVFGLTSGNAMGPGYAVAKAALNALTVRLALEEKSRGILVNAVCPGFTATFDGGEAMGARPVRDGAAGIVWAATLPDDGPTGGFFRDAQPLGW